MKDIDYLKMEDLKAGFLYEISARNAHVGVWSPEVNGFIIPREKFGQLYLFTEYHWDTGAPYGTVRPYREIEVCKFDLPKNHEDDDALLQYLLGKEAEVDAVLEEQRKIDGENFEIERRKSAEELGLPFDIYKEKILLEANVRMRSHWVDQYEKEGKDRNSPDYIREKTPLDESKKRLAEIDAMIVKKD